MELEPLVEDLLSILKNEVHNRKNKNIEALQLAENITRRMNGRYLLNFQRQICLRIHDIMLLSDTKI